MTFLKLGASCLFLAVFLFDHCNAGTKTIAATLDVNITNCSAPQVDLKHKDKIRWHSNDGTDYTIDFSSDDPTPSPFTANSTLSSPREMKGHAKCRKNMASNGCWYKYTLTKVGESKPCGDPIIHIEPGP